MNLNFGNGIILSLGVNEIPKSFFEFLFEAFLKWAEQTDMLPAKIRELQKKSEELYALAALLEEQKEKSEIGRLAVEKEYKNLLELQKSLEGRREYLNSFQDRLEKKEWEMKERGEALEKVSESLIIEKDKTTQPTMCTILIPEISESTKAFFASFGEPKTDLIFFIAALYPPEYYLNLYEFLACASALGFNVSKGKIRQYLNDALKKPKEGDKYLDSRDIELSRYIAPRGPKMEYAATKAGRESARYKVGEINAVPEEIMLKMETLLLNGAKLNSLPFKV